jgi:ABC-type sugar transport system substrate-binding protein
MVNNTILNFAKRLIMVLKQNSIKTIIICVLIATICFLFALLVGCGSTSGESSALEQIQDSTSQGNEPDKSDPENESYVIETKMIGFYADTDNSGYSIMNEILNECSFYDPECDWVIDYRTGNGTVIEQIIAVEDFIAAGCDAIVAIQNNPSTTNTCIEMCVAADIPYFGTVHSFAGVANAYYAEGSTSYDLEDGGYLAGLNASEYGVKTAIIIDSVQEQEAVSNQTLGFLKAFTLASKGFGLKQDGSPWTAEEKKKKKPTPYGDDVTIPKVHGNYDIAVLYWGTCDGSADQAYTVMTKAIESMEYDAWDGIYAQNNTMMEGVIRLMDDTKHTTSHHWLGSTNGSEISWDWVQNGKITMDVNQSSALEAVLIYQMVKEYFTFGSIDKKHIHPYMTAYSKDNINDLRDSLVPSTDVQAFIDGMRAEKFVWRISDPKFTEIPEYQ